MTEMRAQSVMQSVQQACTVIQVLTKSVHSHTGWDHPRACMLMQVLTEHSLTRKLGPSRAEQLLSCHTDQRCIWKDHVDCMISPCTFRVLFPQKRHFPMSLALLKCTCYSADLNCAVRGIEAICDFRILAPGFRMLPNK